ncbi:MAG: 4Fe-4S binding protein [Candidatus Falkowbacteria bacterium]
MSRKINWHYLRRLSQVVVIALVLYLTLRHLNLGIEKAAPIDAYCPFGGFESLLTYLTTGAFLNRILLSSFTLLAVVLIFTIFFGRVFCGYFCPLGALQEMIRGLGRKLGIKKDLELPAIIDKYGRYLKYLILLVILVLSYKLGDLVFRNYDPYNALMHLGNEWEEKVYGYSILIILLIASLFTKSFWCRYFCPLGATLGVVKKISFFRLKRDKKTCVSCNHCNYVCPAGLDVANSDSVKSADCISCLNCVSGCPEKSLTVSIFGKTISKNRFSIMVVVLFAVVILGASLSPLWLQKTESNVKDVKGQINVENIRGSNTLEFVIKESGLPFTAFQTEFNLPADIDQAIMLKEMASKYGLKNKAGEPLETEDFRKFIENNLMSKN